MSQAKYPKAYEAYQQAVYRDGRNPTFWCSIGVLYYQINQYRDALDAYSRAIRLNPYISEVWYDLGTLVSQVARSLFGDNARETEVADHRSCSMNPATTRLRMLLTLMAAPLILILQMFTSRLVCNCCKASSQAPTRTALLRPLLNLRTFIHRLTRPLVWALLQLHSGERQLQLEARLPSLPLLQGRSPIGIAASTKYNLRIRRSPSQPTASITVTKFVDPSLFSNQAHDKSRVGHSLMVCVLQQLVLQRLRLRALVHLHLHTHCPNCPTHHRRHMIELPPVVLLSALLHADPCHPLLLLLHPPLARLGLTVPLLLLDLCHHTLAHSPRRQRSGPFARRDHHHPVLPTLISSIIMARACQFRGPVALASQVVLLLQLLRSLLPKPLQENVKIAQPQQ